MLTVQCVCCVRRYFKQQLNIVCEFVPQVLFLLCMFGYLIILIIVKWIVYSPAESAIAPSLLIGQYHQQLLSY
jgi:V-type H+-transporting ATPase subunit a